MEVGVSFGQWLRGARVQVGVSLRFLAAQLQIAPSYLSDIENDRRIPAEDLLRRFTDQLGLDFEEAMARAGRFGEEVEQDLRRQPEAVRLLRRIAAAKLTTDELRALSDEVENRIRQKGHPNPDKA